MNRSVALAGSSVIAVLGLSLPVAGSLAQPIQTFTKSDGSARSLLQPTWMPPGLRMGMGARMAYEGAASAFAALRLHTAG